MASPQRLEYIDLCKCFAMFCVLLGHSIQYLAEGKPYDNPFWSFIYSFHMPLFMLLSGFFFQKSLNKPFADLFAKKFVQLLLPCIAFFLLTIVPSHFLSDSRRAQGAGRLFFILINGFWFLKGLFACYLIAYVSKHVLRSDALAALASSVCLICIPSANVWYTNSMLPFFWAGYFLFKHREKLLSSPRVLFVASLLAFAALLPFWSGRYTVYFCRVLPFANGLPPDWHNLAIYLFRLAIGLAGSLCFLSACKLAAGSMGKTSILPLLCLVGGNTLGIYLLQTFTLESVLLHLRWEIPFPLLYAVAPAIACTELALCHWLVRRLRAFAPTRLLLLGERRAGGR